MIDCVVITQGPGAADLVAAAEVINGNASALRPLCLDWDEPPESCRRRLRALVGEDRERPLLLLTSVFGSTPHRLASDEHVPGRVEIVTGINLAMAVYLAIAAPRADDLGALIDEVVRRGRASVRGGEDALSPGSTGGGAPRGVSGSGASGSDR